MNTEELYIWRYGIDKLPKGLLEYGKFDVCDTYDESKRQRFQTKGRWMWKDKNGWEENLPPVLYLVCNKKPGILQFDFLDKSSIELKIVSEEFLSLLQENGFIDKYDIATVKVVNKKNESLTDKKYYALRINHFDNDSFHFGKGITYQSDFQKKLGTCFTIYPDMKLKDSSIRKANVKRSISANTIITLAFDRYSKQYSNNELIEIYKQIHHDNELINKEIKVRFLDLIIKRN